MADATGTPNGVVSDEDYRINQAGLITPQTSTLAVRTGVMVAPSSSALVTGTSATGTMTVSIAAHHWVTTRGTADGIYLGTLEAATTVNIAAAPGSNSRIDVVYVKQNDANSTVTPDGSTAPLYGVVTGTAAVSPTKPSIPVGAVELATVTVATGATSTNGAGVTIANTARLVSARGARVWCRTQAERDALTQFAGLEVYRIDTGAVELSNGSTWKTTAFTSDPAEVRVRATTAVLAGPVPPIGTALIVQVFTIVAPTNSSGDVTINFPTAFPTGVVSIQLTSGDVVAGGHAYGGLNGPPSLAAFNSRHYQPGGAVCNGTGTGVNIRVNVTAVGW